ncbi:MAG: hypothetical protein KDC46_04760 [Thermoleophilia bacterium]|nr:hypothetical protein [Thermoleophilia bacterium]
MHSGRPTVLSRTPRAWQRARTCLRVAVLAVVLVVALPGTTVALAAPPANDDFAAATVIPSSGGSTALDSTEATAEPGEPNHYTAFGARQSVWVRWTAPEDGTAIVQTSDASFDTVLGVYTGASVGALTWAASGDDVPDPDDSDWALRTSQTTWSVTAGTTYSIAVDGSRPGDAGTATLLVRMYGPAVDDVWPYDGAVTLATLDVEATLGHRIDSGAQLRAEVEVCSTPMTDQDCVTSGGSLQASGTSAGWVTPGDDATWTSPALPVGTWYWHARAVDGAGVHSPWTEGRRIDVTSDVPAPPALLEPSDAVQVKAKRPGVTVRVRHPRPAAVNDIDVELCSVAPTPAQSCVAAGGTVAATASVAGQHDGDEPTIRFTTATPPGDYFWRARATDELTHASTWSAPRAIELLPTPANDDFVDAITLVGASDSWSGTNVDASWEPGEPMPWSDRSSVWLNWTAPASGTADFSSCGGDYDGVMGVYTGSSVGGLTTLAERDEGCGGFDTYGMGGRVQMPVVAGTTYAVRIGGYYGSEGNIGFDIDLASPPANDDLSAAQALPGGGGPIDVDFVGATREPGEAGSLSGSYLSESGVTVWYQWTAPSSGAYQIEPASMTERIDVGVFTGATHPTLTRVAGKKFDQSTTPITWTATAGTTYRIGLQAPGRIALQSLVLEAAPPPLPTAPTLNAPGWYSSTGFRPTFTATVNHPDPVATSTIEFEVCTTSMSTSQSCTDAGGTLLASGTSASGLLNGATGSWQPATALTTGTRYWHARTTDEFGGTSSWSSYRYFYVYATYATLQLPSSSATTGARPRLWATHYQPQSGATSTIEFEICTANPATTQSCAAAGGTVVGSGASSALATSGAVGSWQPASDLAPGAAFWRARVTDDYGVTSDWSNARSMTITATASPPNDDFAAAQVLAGMSASTSGTNVAASSEYGEPSGSYTVWYQWVAPAAATATIDLCGASFDTYLSVYTGSSVGSLTTVASNDDSCGLASSVTFAAAAGTTYQIRVRSYSSTTGTFPLNLATSAPVPSAPTLTAPSDGAYALDASNLTAQFNHPQAGHTGTLEFQVCADSGCTSVLDSGVSGGGIPIGGSGTFTMTTGLPLDTTLYWRARGIDELLYVGPWSSNRTIVIKADAPLAAVTGSPGGASTGDTTPTLHATYRHVNTARPGHVEFQVCTDATCTATVDSGSSGGGLVNGDDATWTVTAPLTAGQTWYWRARVVDNLAQSGPWAQTSTDVIEIPANDDFANAIVLPSQRARFSGTMVNATTEPGEPNIGSGSYAPNHSVWYSWTAPTDMTAQLGVESYDDYLYVTVFTGADLASLSRETYATTYDGTDDPKEFDVTGGTTYYIQVSHSNWYSPGAFTIVLNPASFPATVPLDGPWPHNDIDSQVDTTQLHATWDPATDAVGTVVGYDVCVSAWTGPDPWNWGPECGAVGWTSLGNVTSATIPLAMAVGEQYRICVRTRSLDLFGLPACTTGVSIVAALPAEPPPPTPLGPSHEEEVVDPPTLQARANFNDPADSGTIEFETFAQQMGEGWYCDEGETLETGAWGPGLAQGDVGSFDTTTSAPGGRMCWHARTVDADGDASPWTNVYVYYVQNAPSSITIAVETGTVDAGTVTAGSTALSEFGVSIDTGGGGAELYVNDSSDTVAATCTCGANLLDVPFGSDPDWWPAGDNPGHAGLTVLDTKGEYNGEGGFHSDWRSESRWGYAPASGADLHDIEASKWGAVPGPSTPLYLATAWGQLDVRVGYRMSFDASPLAGTYSTDLVFTALPSSLS